MRSESEVRQRLEETKSYIKECLDHTDDFPLKDFAIKELGNCIPHLSVLSWVMNEEQDLVKFYIEKLITLKST